MENSLQNKTILAIFPQVSYNDEKAGGLLAVEKVKPDPLNLTVNTVVGKRMNDFIFFRRSPSADAFLLGSAP